MVENLMYDDVEPKLTIIEAFVDVKTTIEASVDMKPSIEAFVEAKPTRFPSFVIMK